MVTTPASMGRIYCSRPYDHLYFTSFNVLDNLDRLIPLVGASLFILSIHFSRFLREGLSNRLLLFLGSISFPLYLLHGIMMKTILSWILYGILPHQWLKTNEDEQFIRNVQGLVFILWMGVLIFVTTIWRDLVDRWSVNFARRISDVSAKKRDLSKEI